MLLIQLDSIFRNGPFEPTYSYLGIDVPRKRSSEVYRKIYVLIEYLLARERGWGKHHTWLLSLFPNFFQSCHFPVQGCLRTLHASGLFSTSPLSPVLHWCHYLSVTFSTQVSTYHIWDRSTITSFLYRITSHVTGRSCLINLYSLSLIHKCVILLEKEIRLTIQCLDMALGDIVQLWKCHY